MSYNGTALVAMTGKNCVGIASDRRFGVQAQTLSTDSKKIFPMHDKVMVGLSGLNTDVHTFSSLLKYRVNMYESPPPSPSRSHVLSPPGNHSRRRYNLREERNISPQACLKLISSMLYGRRFGPYFCEPVVAGLDEENKPFIGATDFFGAACLSEDFAVGGSCTEQLYGISESLYKPNMEPEELFEVMSQCLLAGVDRDCISGWGGSVHIICPDRVISRTLRGRMD
jgi:20S proteasome subunit beta 3